MNQALSMLHMGLARSFSSGVNSPEAWSDANEIARARRRVLTDHGGAAIEADPRSILAAIADFRRTGRVEGFRDLKYVCLGVAAVDARGQCVLAEERLRTALSQQVESQTSFHRRMRCFQALLSSYWMFPLNAKGTAVVSREGWIALRAWLRAEHSRLADKPGQKPPWFETLSSQVQMLSNQPCDKFGEDLLRGDASSLNAAVDGLSIPKDSWVFEEVVFAQMKAVCADPNLTHRADPILTRGWMPTV